MRAIPKTLPKRMDRGAIDELMTKHHLHGLTLNGAGSSGVEKLDDGGWRLTFDGMPNLKFFIELATLAGVPLESIETTSETSYGGCDTCGYGGGTEYFAIVPPSAAGEQL